MEFFEKLFNIEKAPSAVVLSPIDQALLDCKRARDKIKKYVKAIEQNEKQSHQKAKEYLGQGNKERAKFYLKQKKMYMEQVKASEIQLETVTKQINCIEMTMIHSDIIRVMKTSNTILMKLQEEVSVENWNMINDEINEFKEEQRQVAEFFGNRGLIEEDIDKELEQLEEIEFPKAEQGVVHIGEVKAKEKKEKLMIEA